MSGTINETLLSAAVSWSKDVKRLFSLLRGWEERYWMNQFDFVSLFLALAPQDLDHDNVEKSYFKLEELGIIAM